VVAGKAARAAPARVEKQKPRGELAASWAKEAAGYKLPRAIELRDEALPKSGAGKVLKRDLRAPFWEGQEKQVS